jgi:hypothetical protein
MNGISNDITFEKAVFDPVDRHICEQILIDAEWSGGRFKTVQRLACALGRRFIGTPYREQTLDSGGEESLVVNLRAFDCVTFVESVVALALTIKAGKCGFADYLLSLRRLRYRQGRMDGYASRLHYFTDWIGDNQRMGLLADITSRLGGILRQKTFNAITGARDAHPQLRDNAVFQKMKRIETSCSYRMFHVVPREHWRRAETGIDEGDILAIAASREGIDVVHVGFAVRVNGKIRLLHASSRAGAVVLSDVTMNRYLHERSVREGAIVVRLSGPNPE